MLAEKINELVNRLVQEFDAIAPERKQVLEQLTSYIQAKKNVGETAQLVYVCTHNSRRSHFGQVWSAVAAQFYGIEVTTYSGGTEATAFHPNAIAALGAQGFDIQQIQAGENPHYAVRFTNGLLFKSSNGCSQSVCSFCRNHDVFGGG
jgi:arsenate reductase (thioredoxin)